MGWYEDYSSKLVSVDKAVELIKSGDRVVFMHATGEPQALVNALVNNKDKYKDVEIMHMVSMGSSEYTKPEMKEHFRHNCFFAGANSREAIYEGRADYTPCFFSEIPRLFKDKYIEVDVALIQVSPPDKHGYCSLGISVDYTKSACESAKIVIAQVNKNMPRTHGESFLHVSQIDCFVENNEPIIELKLPIITDVEKAIGEYCASLVDDGATLQLGIGSIPDAILMFLKDKKNLGIHSEMISDGVIDLIECGVINNLKKSINKGKSIVSFAMGTRRLYDFIDDNPMVEFYSVDYVNNPYIISKNYKVTSINSCIKVDFMGQVVSETIGLKQFSGVGGQVDFVRGASMCKDGKSIIAMPSTASNGRYSRIVPLLEEGETITTSRNDVHYVVTEYGIAELRGKTIRDRARALIEIAHPNFRTKLIRAWEARFHQDYKVNNINEKGNTNY